MTRYSLDIFQYLFLLSIHLVGAGDALAGEVIVGHGALVPVVLRRRVEVEPVVDVDLCAGRHAADDAHDLVVLVTELRTKVRENFTITERAPY